MRYAKHVSTRSTPQTEPIPGKVMVQNEAGGYGFQVDDWKRLDRFLILGSEGGAYYTGERELTQENAQAVIRCINEHGPNTVKRIVEVSDAGLAPKNAPAVFALALCAAYGNVPTKSMAFAALPKVARIGTDLFGFCAELDELRGWGRVVRNGIANWYGRWSPDQLAYQMVKYQSRNGWSHRDVLRLAHPKQGGVYNDLFAWAVKGTVAESLPSIVVGFEKAKTADVKDIPALISKYGLTREMVPTAALNSPEVWEALLEKMPLHAMLRNLGKMSSVGLLVPMSDAERAVRERLADKGYLKKSRVHPMQVFTAMRVYAQGHGDRGGLVWPTSSGLIQSLNSAFYGAIGNIQPSGQRMAIAIDTSGSMGAELTNCGGMTAAEAAAVMAYLILKTEPYNMVLLFDTQADTANFGANVSLRDIQAATARFGGGTDCSAPIDWLIRHKTVADGLVIYTDSMTWAGAVHPTQNAQRYRASIGPLKVVVAQMAASSTSINEQDDENCLDVVGLDSSVPKVITDFMRGWAADDSQAVVEE